MIWIWVIKHWTWADYILKAAEHFPDCESKVHYYRKTVNWPVYCAFLTRYMQEIVIYNVIEMNLVFSRSSEDYCG